MTGGGIEFNMRRFGLTCDQLAETDMVLASGEKVRASASESTELFWAARGDGGGNFGIHTSFVFNTFAADDIVIFDRTYTSRIDEVLLKVLKLSYDAPRALGLKATVRAKRDAAGKTQIVLNLLGQWAGAQRELSASIAPIDAIATPEASVGFVRATPYWEGPKSLSDGGDKEFGYERSRYAMAKLGAQAVDTVMTRLRAWPGTNVAASWKGFLTGGAIRDVAPAATAFVHRKDWMLTTIDLNSSASDDSARLSL